MREAVGKSREGVVRLEARHSAGRLQITASDDGCGVNVPKLRDAIVERDVWQRAQDILRHNARTGGSSRRNKHGALLKELLRCAPCDAASSSSRRTR